MPAAQEKDTNKTMQEMALDPKVTEEIQRALDMMKRVRIANAEQAEKALKEVQGKKYVLPEPLTLRVRGST